MKTLLLSTDDVQNFNKIVYDHNVAIQLSCGDNLNKNGTPGCNVMALQYYLNHPGTYKASAHAQVQRTHQNPNLAVATMLPSHSQLLKQPTVLQQYSSGHHHQLHHHHHPYFQQTPTTSSPALYGTSTVHSMQLSAAVSNSHSHSHSQNHSQSQSQNHNHSFVPVHALNQNSNFSAASSSTGAGTASSHAPTQQSNTTNSSQPSVVAKGGVARTANTALQGQVQLANKLYGRNGSSGGSSSTKKVKTEPQLSELDQTERFTFANAHILWDEEHWKRIVFQDERKLNLDGPDGFSYYFHDLRNHERSLSQRPRGNSVYIYGIITAGGPIHLDISTARQQPEACIETILHERGSIIAKLGGNDDFVLQDLNWTTNSLLSVQERLNTEGIKTQKWPTIAHDLNIMENVWGWLIREVYEGGRKFSRKDDLIFRIREAWTRLPMDLVTNLYSTLPERITELYYTRGVYTNC